MGCAVGLVHNTKAFAGSLSGRSHVLVDHLRQRAHLFPSFRRDFRPDIHLLRDGLLVRLRKIKRQMCGRELRVEDHRRGEDTRSKFVDNGPDAFGNGSTAVVDHVNDVSAKLSKELLAILLGSVRLFQLGRLFRR